MADQGLNIGSRATVSYNGIKFDELIRSAVTVEPVYNEPDYSIKEYKMKFDFDGIIGPESIKAFAASKGIVVTDGTTDQVLTVLRRFLLHPGAKFEYKDKGFGNFEVSSSGRGRQNQPDDSSPSQIDVAHGPKPRMLTFETLGSNKVARIHMSIEVVTVECNNGRMNGLSELWWAFSYSVNKSGYRTYEYTGKASIHAQMNVNPTIREFDLQEFFRVVLAGELAKNIPRAPDNFALENQTYNVTPDGRSAVFTLTYKEIESPNAFPRFIVDAKGSHTADSEIGALQGGDIPTKGGGFKQWLNNLQLTFTMMPNSSKFYAYSAFAAIALDRILQGTTVFVSLDKKNNLIYHVRPPMILSLKIKENIFDDSVSFNIQWTTPLQNVEELFTKNGLFRTTQAAASSAGAMNWKDWAETTRDTIQTIRGAGWTNGSGAYVPAVRDQIKTGACNQQVVPSLPQSTFAQQDDTALSGLSIIKLEPSDQEYEPGQSHLRADVLVSYSYKKGTATHQRYRPSEGITRRRIDSSPNKSKTGVKVNTDYNESVVEDDILIQDYGNDQFYATVRGRLVRMGFVAEPPVFDKIAGVPAVMLDDEAYVTIEPIAFNANTQAYATTWQYTYRLLGSPKLDIDSDFGAVDPANYV